MKILIRFLFSLNVILGIIVMVLAVLFFSTVKADVGDAKKFHHIPLTLHQEGVIRVLVVDTGVDFSHDMLRTHIDQKDVIKHVDQYVDDHGHGTHIAGLILYGPMDLNKVIRGESPTPVCPQVKISSCKYFYRYEQNKSLNRSINCFKRAAEEDFDVVNYSSDGADPFDAEYQAILELRKKNILFVTVAGNMGLNVKIFPSYPGCYAFGSLKYPPLDNVVPLEAMKSLNEKAPYSNYGEIMPSEISMGEISTLPGNQYGSMRGTSQAAAIYLHKLLIDKCKEFDNQP
jgi:subtilisin family serine protease